MYATYGLTEDREGIEKFIGYVPANFFKSFTEPALWEVKFIKMPDGSERVGRMLGRAFFVQTQNLRASREDIIRYMGIDDYIEPEPTG